jgi:hypothetical protein
LVFSDDYAVDEKAFVTRLSRHIVGQSARLSALASDAAEIGEDYV